MPIVKTLPKHGGKSTRASRKGKKRLPPRRENTVCFVSTAKATTYSKRSVKNVYREYDPSVEDLVVSFFAGISKGTKKFGNEAKRLLKAGKPAVIKVEGLKKGEMLKLYPDDTKEIIRLDEQYNEIVIKRL